MYYFCNFVKSFLTKYLIGGKKSDIIICVLILILGAVYLIRSGNTAISESERMFRDRIVDITLARPRTKEFLIGWPCLAILANIKPTKENGFLYVIISIASSILFASVINSFCHVFTDAVTIYLRTLNGFLFSLPVILIINITKSVLLKKKKIKTQDR